MLMTAQAVGLRMISTTGGVSVYGTITGLTEQYLMTELDRVEEAIARSSTFTRWVDAAGRSHVKISQDLLALAEQEHAIVQELRRRGRSASTALRAAAA
jgi:hypothetical protein